MLRFRWIPLVLLATLLAACGNSNQATGNNNQSPATTAAPTTTTPPTTEAAACRPPCADSRGFSVMVSDYRFNVDSGNQFIQPEAGNVYVQLHVTFMNKTSRSQTASPFDFKLMDGKGITRTEELISPCDSWSSAQLSPGATLGPKCLAFQAASDAPTGITLIWRPGLVTDYKIPLS